MRAAPAAARDMAGKALSLRLCSASAATRPAWACFGPSAVSDVKVCMVAPVKLERVGGGGGEGGGVGASVVKSVSLREEPPSPMPRKLFPPEFCAQTLALREALTAAPSFQRRALVVAVLGSLMAPGKFGRGGAASAVVGLIGDTRQTPPLAEPAPPAPPGPPSTSVSPASLIPPVLPAPPGTLLKGTCPRGCG